MLDSNPVLSFRTSGVDEAHSAALSKTIARGGICSSARRRRCAI